VGTASPASANLRAVGIMARRAAAGAVAQVVAGVFGPVLRAANVPNRDDVPSREDVLRLSRQVATLTSEVRALSTAQQESRERPAVSEPPKSRRRPG
jgi:hypothetical protein